MTVKEAIKALSTLDPEMVIAIDWWSVEDVDSVMYVHNLSGYTQDQKEAVIERLGEEFPLRSNDAIRDYIYEILTEEED